MPTEITPETLLVDRATGRTLRETYAHYADNQKRYSVGAGLVALMMLLGTSIYISEYAHPEKMRHNCITEQASAQVLQTFGQGQSQAVITVDQEKVASCVQSNVEGLDRGRVVWGSLFGLLLLGMATAAAVGYGQKKGMERRYPNIDFKMT